MKRTFNIMTRVKSESGDGLLEIPHPVVLQQNTISELVANFEATWRVPPKGVIIPVNVHDGVLVDCTELGLPFSSALDSASENPFDFEECIKELSNVVSEVYLLLNPGMHYVRSDAYHIVDLVGNSSSQLCVGNSQSQELLGAVLGIAIDSTLNVLKDVESCDLKGVVIDVCSIWPMGGANNRIELTCFCPSCQHYFELESPGLLSAFKTFPNPTNIALATDADSQGIGYIDDISPGVEAMDLVGLSRQKGFTRAFPDQSDSVLAEHARRLLNYLRSRHKQTASALHRIFDEACHDLDEYGIRRIIIMEGVQCAWTSGLQLRRLDQIPQNRGDTRQFDEIWFNPTSSELFLQNVEFRSYLWRRARYFPSAFFRSVGVALDPISRTITGIARLSGTQTRELLRNRMRTAIGTADKELATLAGLPKLKGVGAQGSSRIGFVSAALSQQNCEKLIEESTIPQSGVGINDDAELIDKLKTLFQGGGDVFDFLG